MLSSIRSSGVAIRVSPLRAEGRPAGERCQLGRGYHRARSPRIRSRTDGQSARVIPYTTLVRMRPSWEIRSSRCSPSLIAPRRSIAFCERSFSLSVCSHTRCAPRSSKRWRSCRNFASVFATVRRASRPRNVQPISAVLFARSTWRKRVLPIGRAVADAPREERDLVAQDLLLERRRDPALELRNVARHRDEHQPPDVLVVRHGKELRGVLAAQRLETHVRAGKMTGRGSNAAASARRRRPSSRRRPRSRGRSSRRRARFPPPRSRRPGTRRSRGRCRRGRSGRRGAAPRSSTRCRTSSPSASRPRPLPQRDRLADPDADFGALAFRLDVAVVRLPDRAPFVLDHEHDPAVLGDHVHPLARRGIVGEPPGVAAPLEPGVVRVVRPAHQMRRVGVRHRPQRHALTAKGRRG